MQWFLACNANTSAGSCSIVGPPVPMHAALCRMSRLIQASNLPDLLASLPQLRHLDLTEVGETLMDDALLSLHTCRHLTWLSLESNHCISDTGAAHLAACTSLVHLDLSCTRVRLTVAAAAPATGDA